MTRSQIRYALFRCKAGTANKEHLDVYNRYKEQLDEYGLDESDFTKEWDVHEKNLDEIVTGKIARKYNQYKSLFTGDGQLKE